MTTTIPAGWKLLAKKTCYVLMHDGAVIATLAGPESEENAAIIARMLDAPGVSTVEDAGAHKVVIDFDQVGSAGPFHVIDGRVTIPAVTVMDLVRMAAPAAGDAQVLAALKQAHMALIGFMPQHRNSVIVSAIVAAREAIDAELAAQRKGDA